MNGLMLCTVFRTFMSFGICRCVAGSVFSLWKQYNSYMLRGWKYKKNYTFGLEDVGTMFFRNVDIL
jgi:hypothetical protein